MTPDMESDKWLWQPKKPGPIFIRLRYTDKDGKKKTFTRSLNTDHYPTARKIRDKEFLPIVLDMEQAIAKLELIHELYPQLEEKLNKGKHGGYEGKKSISPTLQKLHTTWVKALGTKGGNYQTAEATVKRYSKIAENFIIYVGKNAPIDEINTQHIIKYRDKRLENDLTSKKTVDLELGAIKRLFKYAVEKCGMKVNPALGITVQRTRAEKKREMRIGKRRPPTHEEADTICTKFPSHAHFSQVDFQDFAMIGRYTGMRQGEVAQLRKKDLYFFKQDDYVDQILRNPENFIKEFNGKIPQNYVLCIFVRDEEARTTKTGDERIVPVADKILPVIERRMQGKSGSIFSCADNHLKFITFTRTWLKKVKNIWI